MASLADFGELDYEKLTDGNIDKETIDTIIGMLSFATTEERINRDGKTISVFEKSFWGKKPKGYITLSYIDDAKLDTTREDIEQYIAQISEFNQSYYSEDFVIPKFSDLLIGFEFSSSYERINVPEIFKTYELGKPRKQIISHGLIMHNIHVEHNVWGQLQLEELNNGMMFSPRERFCSTMCANLMNVEDKFRDFYKYNKT